MSEEPESSSMPDELVCETCFNDNLLKEVGVLKCLKCFKVFCIHFSSRIDPTFCVNCMSEMNLTKEVIHKTYEYYNEQTDEIKTTRRRARRYHMDGQDWLFAQRRIKNLSDAELELTLEYHRELCNLILLEAEERKMEKKHRYAGVKIVAPSAVSVSTTTTVSSTTKTSSTKQNAQLSALIAAMTAKGMTMEQILQMAKGAK